MSRLNHKESCELCQQAVLLDDFVLATQQGEKYFCCEGCKSIFQLLNAELLISDTTHSTNNKES